MSVEPSETTVRITESDGRFTAVDVETGASGTGESRSMALVALATALEGAVGVAAESREADSRAELAALAERTRRRFEEADVTEADVEDAIEWARSE